MKILIIFLTLFAITDADWCYEGKLFARVICASRKHKVGDGTEFGYYNTNPTMKLFGPLKASVTINAERYGYIRTKAVNICPLASPTFLYPVTEGRVGYYCGQSNVTQISDDGEDVFGYYANGVTRLSMTNRTSKIVLYPKFYHLIEELELGNIAALKRRALKSKRKRRSTENCVVPKLTPTCSNLHQHTLGTDIWKGTSCSDLARKYPGWQYCTDRWMGDCYDEYDGGEEGSVGERCMNDLSFMIGRMRICGFGDLLTYTTCKIGIINKDMIGLTGNLTDLNTDFANLTNVVGNVTKNTIMINTGLVNAMVDIRLNKEQLDKLTNLSGLANARIDLNEKEGIRTRKVQRTLLEMIQSLEVKVGLHDNTINETKAQMDADRDQARKESAELHKKKDALTEEMRQANQKHNSTFKYHGDKINANLKHALDTSKDLHNKAVKRAEDLHKLQTKLKEELNKTLHDQKSIREDNEKKVGTYLDNTNRRIDSIGGIGGFVGTVAGKAITGAIGGVFLVILVVGCILCCLMRAG